MQAILPILALSLYFTDGGDDDNDDDNNGGDSGDGDDMGRVTPSQDAKVDLKALIVAVMPIYCLSETINLFFFLFVCVFNKVKFSKCLHFIFC